MEIQLIYSVLGSVLILAVLFSVYFWNEARKANEQVGILETSKNNFETISKKANDIILTIDIVSGVIYDANIRASEVLGYSMPELFNKTIHDLHPTELLELSAQTIARVWDEKGLVYQNLPFKSSKGERIDVECSAKVLIYNNKPVIIIYARDIRERLKLEKEVILKNQLITESNERITHSINYAKRIQQAVLGTTDRINDLFPEAFVYFKPHSIVSGDFYWFHETPDFKIVIAADCTGHGVPGAFMTLLGNSFLEEIIDNRGIVMPNEILTELDKRISSSLNRSSAGSDVNDGMDMAVLTFNQKKKKLLYAGAKNPLCIVNNGELTVVKASKGAIGGRVKDKAYDLHEFDLVPDTTYYIYSDGFQDQFGGKDARKYMSKRFRDFLEEVSVEPMAQQNKLFDNRLQEWKGDNNQTDDILVIGIRLL